MCGGMERGLIHIEHGALERGEGRDALVLGTLGIKHGDEHVTVAVAFGAVGVENVAQAG